MGRRLARSATDRSGPSFVDAGTLLGTLLSLVLGAGCKGQEFASNETDGGQPPEHVAGTYAVAITTESVDASFTSCPMSAWMESVMTTGVGITIMQSNRALTGTLDFGAGIGIAVLIGNARFAGAISGNEVEMVAFGDKLYTEGACNYTLDVTIGATLQGDSLAGTTSYAMVPAPAASCDGFRCEVVQSFNGSRPP